MSTSLLILSCAFSACVETAECDETVGCTEGRVCYDLKCELPCETVDDCRSDQVCAPCQEDLGAGVEDHCFEVEATVCVDAV